MNAPQSQAQTQVSPARIRVFDTTLRDGEQSPGCSMTPQQKVVMARALSDLGGRRVVVLGWMTRPPRHRDR